MLDYSGKRRLVNYHIMSRRSRLTTEEGYDLAFMPKGKPPETAFWRYDNARRRHNLIISEAIDEAIDRPMVASYRASSYRERINFCERVYDHEGSHSLWTDRDNPKLNKLKNDTKIPFHLWNLFEDARIEALWRRTFNRRFNWVRYLLSVDEEPPDPLAVPGAPKNAIRLFLDCTRFENSPKKLAAWTAADKDPKIQFEGKGKAKFGRRQLVMWYYRKAIRCKTTVGLVYWIKSWLKTFPETGAGSGEPGEGEGAGQYKGPGAGDMIKPEEGEKSGSGEMPAGTQDADGSEHEPIKETIQVKSGTGGGSVDRDVGTKAAEEKEEEYKYEGESTVLEVPRSVFFNREPIRKMDFRRADSLVKLFERFLEGGEGIVSSRNPSSKIDMRKFMRGAEDFYLKKGEDPLGVKKISFIMDASGSMSRASEDGVYLAYVLNELVKRRKIECPNMILSGGSNMKVQMPFDPRLLDRLQTPGSHEGFARTMREHERQLVDSDITIFFTDGNITDEHIKKDEWHRKGVYTIGLFTGDPSRSESLHRWFDSVLVRNDIEAVADSLIQLIKRHG